MRKSRLFTMVLATTLLCGCGTKRAMHMAYEPIPTETVTEEATEEKTEAPTEAPTEVVTEAPTEAPTEVVTEAPTKAPSSINWVTYTEYYTDKEGYRYQIDVKLSPWILQSNTEVIQEAWSKVGKKHDIPTIKDWNYKSYKGSKSYSITGYDSANHSFGAVDGITDMYYSVGTVSVSNVTEGWDITENNPVKPAFFLACEPMKDGVVSSGTRSFVGQIYYSSGPKVFSNSIYVTTYLTKNNWGTATIILAHPENVAPAYPNGEYKDYIAGAKYYISTNEGFIPDSFEMKEYIQIPMYE